jgi:arsenate reductase (glutaredoxin)
MNPTAVQIFGTLKSQATKKALRFFKERGVTVHFVDLQQRAVAPGELRRFEERFGLAALLDTGSRAYRDAGLEFLNPTQEQLRERLLDDPALMAQPLIRAERELAVGWDEARWREWHKKARTED